MDKEQGMILANLRLDRSRELLAESKDLLKKGSYKSANNRAFYAIEKSIKALLATEQVEVTTHNGALKQFNLIFIYKGNGTFTQEDYQKVARAEQIRNASDYDDFYLASKEETRQQVENAEYLVNKIEQYIANLNVQEY
ncbi:MAG: HEPN domain-containing protein [Lachnospiraceae bacterium]|nr:HEPN domain-containing protein [Lachnospiraceae bacterium]